MRMNVSPQGAHKVLCGDIKSILFDQNPRLLGQHR